MTTVATASDQELLRSRFNEMVQRKGLRDVCVGILANGRSLLLRASGTDGITDPGSPGGPTVTAGCLTKSVTASLMSEAVAARQICWETFATDFLSCGARSRGLLGGVTIRHLLDHSHGLDASAITAVPYTANGFVDVEALCGEIASQRLSPPGQLYSYGHVGAWLAGAVLERIHGARYRSQLRARRLIPEDTSGEIENICPAMGAGLVLSVSEWLSFAERCMDQLPHTEGPLPDATTLPGWHPIERAIWRGWKYYGEGWFGHNANLSESSAILRINPREQLAIVISAREANGAVVAAAGTFTYLLPEFRNLRLPRLLKPGPASTLSLHRYVGRYVRARAFVDITMGEGDTLELSVTERVGEQPSPPPCRLRPAEGGIFLAESSGIAEFLLVQFIANQTMPASEYLWNGRQLWRKETSVS